MYNIKNIFSYLQYAHRERDEREKVKKNKKQSESVKEACLYCLAMFLHSLLQRAKMDRCPYECGCRRV